MEKDVKQPRTSRVSIYLTKNEKREIELLADSAGLPSATMARIELLKLARAKINVE